VTGDVQRSLIEDAKTVPEYLNQSPSYTRWCADHAMRDKTALFIGLLAAGLYTAFAVIVSHYTLYNIAPNPLASKIVFLCECLKLLAYLGTCSLSARCQLLSEQSYQRSSDSNGRGSARDQLNGAGSRQGSSTSAQQQQQAERSPLKPPSSAFRVASKGPAESLIGKDSTLPWWSTIAPAVLCCAANNLLLHALTLLPAHAYASLSIVRIPATALVISWALSSSIDSSTQWNLGLILLGACMSQMAAYRAFPASEFAMANGNSSFWGGCFTLLAAILLSAAAAAYLAWFSAKRQQQQQQSQLLMDSLQLSAAGAAIAAVFYLMQGGQIRQLLGNVCLEHWAAAAALAALGLLQASPLLRPSSSSNGKRIVTIARSGSAFGSHNSSSITSSSGSKEACVSIAQAYGVTLAAIFTAWASGPILALHVPLLHYAGACVALFGVMRLHYSRSQTLPRIKSRINLLLGDCGGWRPVIVRLWKYAFVAKVCAVVGNQQ
jgi:hypothetical protein